MAYLRHKYKINRNRPTIGITGPDKGGEAAWLFTALSVLLAGGKPVHITPTRPRTADGLQALIIGGGADVDPSTYEQQHVLDNYLQQTINQPNKSLLKRIGRFLRWLYFPVLFFIRKLLSRKLTFGLDKARDHLELQLLDQAVKKDLPVMGICRGAQLLNVYFRGTLYKSIHTFYTEEPNPASIFPVKEVLIKPETRLAAILGTERLLVNALHNQAVQKPGEDICIAAQEPNQVVQAIEHTKKAHMIGVQWHPEYLPQSKLHRRLFKALVQQARLVSKQIEEQDMQEALATKDKEEMLKELQHQA
ncbi:gamma-glutamyl-gamma-aminobutyrate hydrolase family protein [Pontibacter cellulosilyticus]|uniref:Gamma-glutamyl-gamma-aminobutyrate hydrolase family protein n=1 Tax=Pontibacter cellulosilyticus TaxID=1720253 RepID=A0A923SHW1_9BACT|nr:gamma-glutamyl-gamma-aminobutyrate hydrolase family protein [Pontibacter cellulosilyticus]MBC5991972.1 gamma-glutamyl-gamma-aminobutyrate hydrolase family protein [Pontibacter cellulosilyticus]